MDGFDAALTLVILFALFLVAAGLVEGWRWLVTRRATDRTFSDTDCSSEAGIY